MLKNYWKKGKKQKTITVLLTIILVLALFFMRDEYQPVLLFLRKYIFIEIVCLIFLFFTIRAFRNAAGTFKRILMFLIIVVFFGFIYWIGWHVGMYSYMQKYLVFKHLNLQEVEQLPLTQNERVQPYNNILTMAYESVSETQEVSLPQLVRVDGNNDWTMAVQPAKEYAWQRVSERIEDIFSVSSTTPFPRFSGENRIPVDFSIGESLAFSRNTKNASILRFNFFQLFSHQPCDVFFMKDDAGEWVQVVSLIKWKGFLFPYPVFGGVIVMEAGKHQFADYIERITIGKGIYIPPSKMKEHPFLQKQNTLSEFISRMQAQSLMFLGGFTDPLPWNMETAVKIPDLEDDQNPQPFVTDFNFENKMKDAYSGLYHWFGLEPIGDERTSLAYSVFIPADGTDLLMYYNHAGKKEGMAGVSAMPLKVMESRKNYDWTVNRPVEFRPYIRDIAGRKRMFVLSTVASKRDDSKRFDGSATPDLALVDVQYRDVIWVDVKHPDQWDRTIYNQLHEVWRSSEGIGYFYVDENEKDSLSVPEL